jgi:hypothetical protein
LPTPTDRGLSLATTGAHNRKRKTVDEADGEVDGSKSSKKKRNTRNKRDTAQANEGEDGPKKPKHAKPANQGPSTGEGPSSRPKRGQL